MDTSLNDKNLFSETSEAIKKSVKTASKTASDFIETVESVKNETVRMGRNGTHSLEDLKNLGVHAAKNGVAALTNTSKKIIDDPKVIATASKAALQQGQEALSQAKDSTLDVFRRRDQLAKTAKEFSQHAAKLTTAKIQEVACNPKETGKDLLNHAGAIAKGVKTGTIGSLQGISGHLQVGRDDFESLLKTIESQSVEHEKLSGMPIFKRDFATDSSDYLDAILVGGDSLDSALALKVPPDVLMAYEMHMPVMSQLNTFKEYIESLATESQRDLFISKIKGKLFEIQYVDYLNENLPTNFHAELAKRANEPGWDIQVTGPDEVQTEYLQLKATHSVQYIQRALERYPDVPVVTTSEVHAELVMRGLQEKVTDSKINVDDLTAHVKDGVEISELEYGGPSLIALALIAFTSYQVNDMTLLEKSRLVGDRTGSYAICYLVGLGADVGTGGMTFASMIAASVSRLVISSGLQKIDRRNQMIKLIEKNEMILNKMRIRRIVEA